MGDTAKIHNLGRQSFGSDINRGKVPDRQEALTLLKEWVRNPRLELHCLQIGMLMKTWAQKILSLPAADIVQWEVAGILHDADWDQWPDEHCSRIIKHLEEEAYDPDIIHAIASHSPAFFGVEPVSQMDKMLYAFDELSGFIHAVSLVRPSAYEDMTAKSVKKKLKDKSFAAQVNRGDIEDSISRLDVGLDELISFIITHQSSIQI